MKILFVTTKNPKAQGDLLEVSILHGLRTILGDNCVDFPRKKIMYHDWSETKKEELHGRGFTLYKYTLQDIENRNIEQEYDVILYGVTEAYGEKEIQEINELGKSVWFLDGHDLYGSAPRMIQYAGEKVIGVQKENSFKRELLETTLKNVFPTGFGIPKYQIREIDFSKKIQLFQKTAPDASLFKEINDLGGTKHHKFTKEEEYYEDLSNSWFGLTCKKGGWDCLRHYEIIASGTLLLFRDYHLKPALCSPQKLPCYSYSTKEQLEQIVKKLVVDNKPTKEYINMLNLQREWLYNMGTTEARAKNIIKILEEKMINE
jgi:hypothetical protein